MIAYVTSIGESTTELCVWSLKRNGFEVELLQDGTSLAQKLKKIYELADDDFTRVDADVVPNRNFTVENVRKQEHPDAWWIQFRTFGWYSQTPIYGGVQFIKKEAIPYLRKSIDKYIYAERPETQVARIEEFYNPRRFVSSDMMMGLHGYKQNDVERIKRTKLNRNQFGEYDWELAERIGRL